MCPLFAGRSADGGSDPRDIMANSGVDTWFVMACALVTTADNSYQESSFAILLGPQIHPEWTAGITLACVFATDLKFPFYLFGSGRGNFCKHGFSITFRCFEFHVYSLGYHVASA